MVQVTSTIAIWRPHTEYHNFCSVIIHLFASNSPSLMRFGVPGLKEKAAPIFVLLGTLFLVSCANYSNPSSNNRNTTGLKLRAFVTNPLRPTGFGSTPVIEVIDALNDKLSGPISLSTAQPGLMAVFPNKRFTLVYGGGSGSNNSIAIINNAQEAVVGSALSLPGPSESMVVSPDNVTGYVAVPSASVNGRSQGVVEVLNLNTNTITATLPVPGARFVAVSHNGNRVLVFGNPIGTFSGLALITPSHIGTSQNPVFEFPVDPAEYDHPVGGVFSSDDSTAYILNCGAECTGTAASVTALNMNTNAPGLPLAVEAATIGMLSGTTLFVAGTPPGTSCPSGTAGQTCGTLSVIDTASMTVSNQSPIFITDGYHNRMEMGANGQLFIGARTCSTGCLSIFDTNQSKINFSSDTGDVTGIQPITTRNVVYVCENDELRIYDTTTDKLQANQIDIIGQAVDVKLVD